MMKSGSMRGIRAILYRELLTRLRHPYSFLSLALLLLVLALSMWLLWPRQQLISLQESLAERLFTFSCIELFVVFSFLTPVFTATSVTLEREQKSLEIMLATPISTGAILLGKGLSAILYLTLLIVVITPVVGLCFFAGGVSLSQILAEIGLLIAVVMVLSSFSLLCSCSFHHSYAALTIAYLAAFPFIALVVRFFVSNIQLSSLQYWQFIILCIVGSLAGLLLSVHRLEKPSYEPTIGLTLQREIFPDRLLAPLPPDEEGNVVNPVYYRELYYETTEADAPFMRQAIQLSAIVSVCMTAIIFHYGALFYAYFLCIFAMTVIPAIAGSSFTRERERATYEILQTMPLSFRQVFFGKFIAALRLVVILLALQLFPLAMAIFASELALVQLFLDVTVLISFSAFSVAIALSISYYCSTTFQAITTTYLVFFVLFALPFLCHFLLIGSIHAQPTTIWTGYISTPSPFAAILQSHGSTKEIFAQIARYSPPLWQTLTVYAGGTAMLLLSFCRKWN